MATATTADNQAICPATALSLGRVVVVSAAAVETATTADNRVIFPGTAPSQDRAAAAVVAAAADATTFSATVVLDTATCRANAANEFQLE